MLPLSWVSERGPLPCRKVKSLLRLGQQTLAELKAQPDWFLVWLGEAERETEGKFAVAVFGGH